WTQTRPCRCAPGWDSHSKPRYGPDGNAAFREPGTRLRDSGLAEGTRDVLRLATPAERRPACGCENDRSAGKSRTLREPVGLSYITSSEGPSFRVGCVSGPLAACPKGNPLAKAGESSMDRAARFFRKWNQRVGRVVSENASAHPRMNASVRR